MSGAHAIVVGAGPAGLMAAESLSSRGVTVDVYDGMPSVGRKFLLAGIGGLNLTHSEPVDAFKQRYGGAAGMTQPWLERFGPAELRDWTHGLGVDTFVGTSGRVFPVDMKAAPLLRAWLARLRRSGVRFHMRHRWSGWDDEGRLVFQTAHDRSAASSADAAAGESDDAPAGPAIDVTPPSIAVLPAGPVVLALGGGSWARLGSDGAWVPWLRSQGVDVAPLVPANCGFDIGWSDHFRERHAGEPVKPVSLEFVHDDGRVERRQGEFVVTQTGVEGSLVYAFSAPLRDRIAATGEARITLDLLPAHDAARVEAEVARPRGPRSMSTHLKSRLGLQGVKAGLLWEALTADERGDAAAVARALKALPLTLRATRPLDEAISSAGGVMAASMDEGGMLRARPGVFCAGEMLDWEAPTGGYLMTACMASGRHAGLAAADWAARPTTPRAVDVSRQPQDDLGEAPNAT